MRKINSKVMLKLWPVVMVLATMIFANGCIPTAAPEGGGEEGTSILPLVGFLVLIFGFMYFAVIRPQRRKQKEHQQLVEELRRGDKVITSGGIYGVVENVSDESVVIKVESGTTLRVAKSSLAGRREK